MDDSAFKLFPTRIGRASCLLRYALLLIAALILMAMVFLVLMQAAKSAREDLKAIMDGVKGINAAKQALREQLVLMMERTEGRRPTWPPR